MTRPNSLYKYKQEVDYLADIVGADVAKDLIKVGVDPEYTGELDVTAADVPIKSQDFSTDSVLGSNLPGDGETTVATVSATGASALFGQVKASGQFDVRLDWLDDSGDTLREETIHTDVAGNSWAELEGIDPKTPDVDVVVVDKSGSGQTVTASVNMV